MIFSKIATAKLTTDFENRTKRQAETKACVFLDVDYYAIPYKEQVQSILQPEMSTHYVHFRFECKILNLQWHNIYAKTKSRKFCFFTNVNFLAHLSL